MGFGSPGDIRDHASDMRGRARRPGAELTLVLASARSALEVEMTSRIRALCTPSLNWPLAIDTAHTHGLMPLLYFQLTRCPDVVPAAILDTLRLRFQRNALRSVLLVIELRRLLGLFAGRGIAAVPFKGPTLAAVAYGDVTLRHYLDLDILVPRSEVLAATRVLESEGYRPSLRLTATQHAAFLGSHCEYILVRERDGVCVELHWEIVPGEFGVSMKTWDLWSRVRSIPLLDTVVPAPAVEDLLVVLCVHASKHCWSRIGWVCDVAELVRAHPDLDWREALERARALGAERMVLLGLVLAQELLGAPLPAAMVPSRVAADGRVRVLARRVARWVYDDTVPAERSLEAALFHLAMRERGRDKFRYGRRLAFTATVGDWETVPLPGALFSLYRFLRPARLAWRHGRALVRHCRWSQRRRSPSD
jgi:hypothetical protein